MNIKQPYMKLRHESAKPRRLSSRFINYTTFEDNWIYNLDLRRWERIYEVGNYNYSSHAPCRSKRAFAKAMKKAPNGVVFLLVNRWLGYDIEGIGAGK